MRALRVAPALLLALAACSVETGSLEPKTDAVCQAQDAATRACGYKCVRADDPATGCGGPGCRPCVAAAAGDLVYCDANSLCASKPRCGPQRDYCGGLFDTTCEDLRTDPQNCGACGTVCTFGCTGGTCDSRPPCPTGQAYCDGPVDTVCDDLATSPVHCGACGHSCGAGSCSALVCTPTLVVTQPGALDLSSDGPSTFLLVTGLAPGVSTVLKDFAPWASWTGAGSRIEADPWGLVAWDRAPASTIWSVDYTGTPVISIFAPSGNPLAGALDPAYFYLVESGGTAPEGPNVLVGIPRAGGGTSWPVTFALESQLTAVAAANPFSTYTDVLVGGQSGLIQWVSWDASAGGTYASGQDVPVRLVVFSGAVGPQAVTKSIAFWLGATGNLYRKELPSGPAEMIVGPTTTASNYLDLWADADGVYWIDDRPAAIPLVAAWRAAYDDVLPLAWGDAADPPARVTATTSGREVYWLSAVSRTVRAVPK